MCPTEGNDYQADNQQGQTSFKKLKVAEQVLCCVDCFTKIWIRSVHMGAVLAGITPAQDLLSLSQVSIDPP